MIRLLAPVPVDTAGRKIKSRLSSSGFIGPQLVMNYSSAPAPGAQGCAARPAELTVEVGQMLVYFRVKQHGSVTAFMSQLSLMTKVITGDHKKNGSHQGQQNAATSPANGPRPQSALRLDITIVGVDVLFRVQSRDLMSLKLQQGRVVMDQKAITAGSAPTDIRTHLSATVQDIMIQDVRVRQSWLHGLVSCISLLKNIFYCTICFTCRQLQSIHLC